jgi:hypothetical protein
MPAGRVPAAPAGKASVRVDGGAVTLLSLPDFGEGRVGVFFAMRCVVSKSPPRPSPKSGREKKRPTC